MSSDKDCSEGSSVSSPPSHLDSPYSSPSQQVPYLANAFSGISCGDDNFVQNDGKRPFLRIVDQPQVYFRFRYRSEMLGTHGCILGRSVNANKTKSHPTVELMNYTGRALIRVRLAQADKEDEHPHKLLEDEQEDRDVSALVPEQGSYIVAFAGMGIIHTAKKAVPDMLFQMHRGRLKEMSHKELRAQCEYVAKTINLNIVRLKFSAHDVVTDKEICPPVFSEPISNMKSAATNDLKICRISRYFGRPRGGDDVFILVEKVNRKNIVIRFYELDENGDVAWSADANFLQSDVHHQYAIVFRTPPYKDPHISKDVKVLIGLVRPSDGRISEPKEFVYKADQMCRGNKRRRGNSSLSSLDSSSGGSIKSIIEVPAPVEMMDNNERMGGMNNLPVFQINLPHVPTVQPTTNNDLMADALLYGTGPESSSSTMSSPMFGQPNIPEPPVIQLNSMELERLINHDPNIPSEERKQFCSTDWTEYMASFGESLQDKSNSMSDFIRSSMQLVADGPKNLKKEPMSPVKVRKPNENNNEKAMETSHNNAEYNAVYTTQDGHTVKTLVKEICELVKDKSDLQLKLVRKKVKKLLDLRLSNGDTFLHMALVNSPSSFEFMVKLISTLGLKELLNLTNDAQHTILHLAVFQDQPRMVSFLVSKGCDPMVTDKEGNSVIHYAVISNTCMKPLLDAIKACKVPCDLNAYNNEKQTALHLAANYNAESSVELLLRHGAHVLARDRQGRTPLHLAVYDGYLGVVRALLRYMSWKLSAKRSTLQDEVDAVDEMNYTALQIVCGSIQRQDSLEIARLLLENKADPLKHGEGTEPAIKLARDKPALAALLRQHTPSQHTASQHTPSQHTAGQHTSIMTLRTTETDDLELEIKSEPEDEFESADEGERTEAGMTGMGGFVGPVSALLEAREGAGWRRLCARLQLDSLRDWLARTNSPARSLLNHLKESGDMTSKQLAIHLDMIGEVEAANVIRQCIE